MREIQMIGLYSDQPGAGKDTFAAQLVALYPQVKLLSFAEPLSQEVYKMFSKNAFNDVDLPYIRHDPKLKDYKFHAFALKNVSPDFDKYVAFCVSKLNIPLGKKLSIRDHLILYGTKYVKEHLRHPDKWLRAGMSQAQEAYSAGKMPVFTDVRFPNEADRIRQVGGVMLKIQPNWERELNGLQNSTEGLLDDFPFDGTILNIKGNPEGMLEQFHKEFKIHD